MYGLKSDTDLQALRGLELSQVCVGRNEVIFRFEERAIILVTSSMEFRYGPDSFTWCFGAPEQAACVLGILGTSIDAYNILDGGCLELRFSNGGQLFIFDSNEHYESYMITIGDRYITV